MKKEIFALTLSAVMAAGTCSIPVMAADDTCGHLSAGSA